MEKLRYDAVRPLDCRQNQATIYDFPHLVITGLSCPVWMYGINAVP